VPAVLGWGVGAVDGDLLDDRLGEAPGDAADLTGTEVGGESVAATGAGTDPPEAVGDKGGGQAVAFGIGDAGVGEEVDEPDGVPIIVVVVSQSRGREQRIDAEALDGSSEVGTRG
jgi:hypothetical protein